MTRKQTESTARYRKLLRLGQVCSTNVEHSKRVTSVKSQPLTNTIGIWLTSSLMAILSSLPFTAKADLNKVPGMNEAEATTAAMTQDICPKMLEVQDSLTPKQQDLLFACGSLVHTSNEQQDTVPTGLSFGYDEAELRDALLEVAHEEVAGQGTQATKTIDRQFTNIAARSQTLRLGTGSNLTSSLMLDFEGAAIPGLALLEALTATPTGGAAGDDVSNGKWGYFINGRISFGEKDPTDREAGFDYDTSGITAGADYRFADTTFVGGALGYISSEADIDNNGGATDTEGFSFSIYGTHFRRNDFYVDGLISAGANDYDTKRNILFPNNTISDTFKGETDGSHYAVNLGIGRDFASSATGWNMGLFSRISYFEAEIDGYSESGGDSALELEIKEQDVESLLLSLGGQVSKAFSKDFGIIVPQLRVEYLHEFLDDSRSITARYVHDPFNDGTTLFSVPTDDPDRNYFSVAAGLSTVFSGGKQAFINYETTVALDDITNHSIIVGFRGEL